MKPRNIFVFSILFFLTVCLTTQAQVKVDPNLPAYKPESGISGTIKSIGSDTMNNLMSFWAQGFQKFHPSVKVEIEGKGSSTAPPALIAGTANFGPMSRKMKDAEIDEFQKKFGYKPTALETSIDVLAVYVNKDNPIKGLSLPQVDAIFSKTRKSGYKENIRTWGEAGLKGSWANQPISLYGRNAASGTYGVFKEIALFGGDYKDSVQEQPGSSNVVQGVARDLYGIGYSGIGYKTADVRAVPLSRKGNDYKNANAEDAYTGQYPLARFLYVYANYQPGGELTPLSREFIKYIFSQQGQEVVVKDGYYPINAVIARNNLKKVGITP